MRDRTVLFVDDEIDILNSLKRGLIDEDYKCLFALCGEEALEVIDREEISVIVTDMRMPGMDGLTLLRKVREKSPNTVRVVLSGYTQLPQILATINQGDIFKFITKPWSLEDEFIPAIRQSIEYYNLQQDSLELKKTLEARNLSYQNVFKSMDEKLSNSKRDFENVKSISRYVLDKIVDIYSSRGSDDIADMGFAEQLNLIRQLYIDCIEVLPTVLSEFELKTLARRIEADIIKAGYTFKLETDIMDQKGSTFYGNFNTLHFIIVYFFSRISKITRISKAELTLSIDRSAKGKLLDIFAEMTIKASNNELEGTINKEMSLIGPFLNELSKIMGGSVVTYMLNNTVMIKLQVQS